MPNHKSTEKMLRKDAKRYKHNMQIRSKVRTLIKNVRLAVAEKNPEAARENLRRAVSQIDTAAKKHIIHPRNASRRKSRLMKMVDSMNPEA